MDFRQTVPAWLAVVLTLSGCGGFAGTAPQFDGAPAGGARVDAGTWLRLSGQALLADRALVNPSLRLFDLLTGAEYPVSKTAPQGQAAGRPDWFSAEAYIPGLISNQTTGQNLIAAGSQNLIAAGSQNLIAAGGQNLTDSPPGVAGQAAGPLRVFRLVAEENGVALVSLVDSAGRSVASEVGAAYRLRQAGPATVVLTPASTLVAKAFEGALKLQYDLASYSEQAAGITEVFGQARQALRVAQQVLAAEPERARRIATALDGTGAVRDPETFRRAATEGGLGQELSARLSETLTSWASRRNAQPDGALALVGRAKIDAQDFPAGGVLLKNGGELEVRGKDGETLVLRRPPATPSPDGGDKVAGANGAAGRSGAADGNTGLPTGSAGRNGGNSGGSSRGAGSGAPVSGGAGETRPDRAGPGDAAGAGVSSTDKGNSSAASSSSGDTSSGSGQIGSAGGNSDASGSSGSSNGNAGGNSDASGGSGSSNGNSGGNSGGGGNSGSSNSNSGGNSGGGGNSGSSNSSAGGSGGGSGDSSSSNGNAGGHGGGTGKR
ncbi:MAG: hypothetical protein VKP62_06200 [Candidatus Sericytochromatia bacterium]|nr:hypothetical protein [Candidatus Sericytochromatia bacterium]